MSYNVLGKDKLVKFWRRHQRAKAHLEAWLREAQAAELQTPQDIKNRYASASFLRGNRVIFNIKGNDYRLLIQIRYQGGIIVVERVGTHAEYDEWRL